MRCFVFVILSNQNACNGCENAENRTWFKLFYDGRKFRRQRVNMIDVRSYFIFNMWKFSMRISDLLCSDLNLNLGKLFALTWNSRWNGFLLTKNWISNAKFHQAMVITPFRWNPVTPKVIHTNFTWSQNISTCRTCSSWSHKYAAFTNRNLFA